MIIRTDANKNLQNATVLFSILKPKEKLLITSNKFTYF